MKIAILIASAGRPENLGRWKDYAAHQTLAPAQMVWSVGSKADLPGGMDGTHAGSRIEILIGSRGLPHQRNSALSAVRDDIDLVAFFDDDYVPALTCLEGIARAFAALPDVIGLSGHLLADGARGAGVTFTEAQRLIAADNDRLDAPVTFEPGASCYGCNMVWRASAIAGLLFDENLPLYAWLEDADFSARAAKAGLIGYTKAFSGAHMAVKNGRPNGLRLGYSQVANTNYLARKGVLSRQSAMRQTLQHLASNHLKSLSPEPWVDRHGRARGNRRAVWDLLRGKLDPNAILDF